MKNIFAFLIICICLSCNSNTCKVDESISQIPVDIKVDRLENELFKLNSKDEIKSFLVRNPVLTKFFLASDQYPDDSVLVDNLYNRLNNVYIDTLLEETRKEFDDLAELKPQMEMTLKHIKHYYPDAPDFKLETLVTGMGSSELYVSDTLVIVGLDYYIGPNATYRPIGIPEYILRRYQKDYITPAVTLLLSSKYLREDPSDNTMLADMVYYGKRYYFAKRMMPCTPDSLIIWYSGQQLKEVHDHEDVIWAYFISNKLLFETNHITKTKYMDERPTVFEIGDKCPGRIGEWLGWQIVESYMVANPQVSLNDLMANPNAGEIFSKSGYKPRRR